MPGLVSGLIVLAGNLLGRGRALLGAVALTLGFLAAFHLILGLEFASPRTAADKLAPLAVLGLAAACASERWRWPRPALLLTGTVGAAVAIIASRPLLEGRPGTLITLALLVFLIVAVLWTIERGRPPRDDPTGSRSIAAGRLYLLRPRGRAHGERLAAALQTRGWPVFYDRHTPIGPRFDQHIANKLRTARCVVVLWSEASVESGWVAEEAARAKKRGVFAPVRLHDVDPPFGFGLHNHADLFGWHEGRAHPGFDQLLARITELAGSPTTTPDIPAAFLDWVWRTYAGVDLLGQDIRQGRTITLSHVYVPALTTGGGCAAELGLVAAWSGDGRRLGAS